MDAETQNENLSGSPVEIAMTRHFDAPPGLVYRAFTDPVHLSRWWGPEGFTCPECETDATEGGKWRTTMRSPEGTDHTVSGEYLTLSEFDRIRFTWAWDQEDGSRGHETIVDIQLEQDGAATRMQFLHKTFQDEEACSNHLGGWTSSWACLVNFLADQAK